MTELSTSHGVHSFPLLFRNDVEDGGGTNSNPTKLWGCIAVRQREEAIDREGGGGAVMGRGCAAPHRVTRF